MARRGIGSSAGQGYARGFLCAETRTPPQRSKGTGSREAPPAGAAPAGTARRAPDRAIPRGTVADNAPGGAAYPYKWYAAPGPNRRGNMCVTHTDALRGYGFQAPCKK